MTSEIHASREYLMSMSIYYHRSIPKPPKAKARCGRALIKRISDSLLLPAATLSNFVVFGLPIWNKKCAEQPRGSTATPVFTVDLRLVNSYTLFEDIESSVLRSSSVLYAALFYGTI